MNTEIERELIGIFLNHPNKARTVGKEEESSAKEEDYFAEKEYRKLYEAIINSEADDLIDIYGKYKNGNKQALDFQSVKQIMNEAPPLSQLYNNIYAMRKLVVMRRINKALEDYRSNPYDENKLKLLEALQSDSGEDNTSDDGKLDEAVEALEDSLVHPKPRGVKTFKQLDEVLGGGMYGSMLFTIGARPSTGKTAFAVNLAYEAMRRDKEVEVDFFTLEMNKQEMLNRFISRDIGVSSGTLRSNANEIPDVVKELVKKTASSLLDSNLRIYDGLHTLGEIVRTIRKNASKAKLGGYMAIVDYIGLVKVPGKKERRLEIDEVTRELKELTNEFDIPIVELSQLSRGVENRQYKEPVLSDLKESGSIEQDSNVVAFLHRPENVDSDRVVQLAIRKNREGELANINFTFIGEEMKFVESG
ncbi:replicative DNA helicase [Pediococcus pentosaceus]|uniref:replicative DNA helicase n=1 Tax=Pediococcus pentosaceus TaxID=1255 RepID=UPI0018FE94AC|nr:DnaB-like helicase C-terminal domain-containing protein [Pediococcus pentosaceus]MBF7122769.1 DnaB-like helicase C-terminal domain-containing protein [Pediococcus pentosaceus]